jgi:hypothetical protein
MRKRREKLIFYIIFLICFCIYNHSNGQKTQIRGFIDALASYQQNKTSFSLGEQDLFITSELTDRFSFLGESVFKYTLSSPTSFSVSIERVVIKYNISGNHNLLIGKHHSPLNYWNDTYHHGRVFFPTIFRPLLFDSSIIPLHTTGISIQGQNLGKLKFGYDLMLGNGIGSSDVLDNDKRKSLTAAIHIKPANGLRIGFSWYNDKIAKGTKNHDGNLINWEIKQNLFSGSVAYFGKKVELLAEGTLATNHTDTTGSRKTLASYFYAGFEITDKWVPYIRVDQLHFNEGELFYDINNSNSFVGGIRYFISYLTVVKLEYQYLNSKNNKSMNKVTAQIAIGF